MQDFLDSRAAVEAMAALQDRIRELESENGELRKKSVQMRTRLENCENEMAEREEFLSKEADKAQRMLESASETLIELRRIRIENRKLEAQLHQMAGVLQGKMNREERGRRKLEDSLDGAKHTELLESELEDLFSLLLSPPDFEFEERLNVNFAPTIASITTYSVPITTQTTIRKLQNLPKPFSSQRIEMKKDIIATMISGRMTCCKLIEEIHKLELEKLTPGARRRAQGSIDAKMAQLYLLTQAMSKFSMT